MEDQDLEFLNYGFPTRSSYIHYANIEGVSYYIIKGIYII